MLRRLFRHYWTAENGTEQEKERLSSRPAGRPWDPATLGTTTERMELWRWLEEVVRWFNHEYAWDTSQVIPDCWPEHPHLVHEIAVLADARRRAGEAYNSGPLEEWHRICVPWFLGRMRDSIRAHCEDRHQAWPARARYARHVGQPSFDRRHLRVMEDVEAVGFGSKDPWIESYGGDRVNVITGEVANAAQDAELAAQSEAQELESPGQAMLPLQPPVEDSGVRSSDHGPPLTWIR